MWTHKASHAKSLASAEVGDVVCEAPFFTFLLVFCTKVFTMYFEGENVSSSVGRISMLSERPGWTHTHTHTQLHLCVSTVKTHICKHTHTHTHFGGICRLSSGLMRLWDKPLFKDREQKRREAWKQGLGGRVGVKASANSTDVVRPSSAPQTGRLYGPRTFLIALQFKTKKTNRLWFLHHPIRSWRCPRTTQEIFNHQSNRQPSLSDKGKIIQCSIWTMKGWDEGMLLNSLKPHSADSLLAFCLET